MIEIDRLGAEALLTRKGEKLRRQAGPALGRGHRADYQF